MKKAVGIVIVLAVVGSALWFVWFKHPAPPEEEAKVATEVPVHIGKITNATLRGYITAYGLVEPEPAGARPAATAHVATAVPGVVSAVYCTEGQHVDKDAVLFQIDSRAADVAVSFAEKTVERQKKLLEANGTSIKALQDAEQQLATARAQQALLQIRSPLAGTITRVGVRPGEAVDLTMVAVEVTDLDRLVVSVNVPSSELAAVKAGKAARVELDQTTEPVAATVDYVGAQVDPKTGTALVRAALPPGSSLHPGQFVTLRIVDEEHKDCLAAPAESVVKNEDGNTVIAVLEGDKAVQKPVEAGLREGDLVEIKAAGLKVDMPIVTTGAYGLPKETKVRVLGD